MRKIFTSAFAAIALCASAYSQEILSDQYGVCSHITRDGEMTKSRKILSGINEAGVQWTRTEFDWAGCNPQKGVWDCQHLDQVLSAAKKAGVNVLPVLTLDVSWARPAVEHLYEWGEYVREMVSRYGNQARYWEVYPEPNLKAYWRRNPSGAEYVALLQKTWNVIKSIDPSIKVVLGGLSGIPLDYIEDALKAGAGDYFDVMNIHPNCLRDLPEAMIPEISRLQRLMVQYGIGDKPVWITEIGWSTPETSHPFGEALEYAYDCLGIEKGRYPLVCVRDRRYGESHCVNCNPVLSDRFTGELEISMDAIASVNPASFPVMLPSRGEQFPVKYIPALQEYLRKGGTLVFSNGSPIAYDLQIQEDGSVKPVQVGRKYYGDLHIQLEYNWSNILYPKIETWQAPAGGLNIYPGFKKYGNKLISRPYGRFLTQDRLKGGDSFIPIINAGTDKFEGCIVGLYRLDSDLKGNIIVSTGGSGDGGVTPERQAAFLSRAYILSYALGVSKVFWAGWRAPEEDRTEIRHHYGIVHKDLSPKPALAALKTLSGLMPSGSTRPQVSRNHGIYTAHWKNARGKDVWAWWCELGGSKVIIDWEGEMEESVDHLGGQKPIAKGSIDVLEGCTYAVGPTRLSIERH